MKKQDQLFYLIKSLSNKEKNNFKKRFFSKKTSIKLFDVIDSQDKFDANQIKELFKNTKFIKQLHVTKNYLTKDILKSLREDSSPSSVNIQLNNLLTDIELLFGRELFDQCLFFIKKAQKLASEYEKFTYTNIILDWKRKVYIHQKNIFENRNEFDKVISSQIKGLNYIENELQYWDLTINQFNYFGKSKEEKKVFFDNPLLTDINNAKSIRSKTNYFHIQYTNAVTSNNPQLALENLDQLIKILENNPLRIIEDPSSYITTLNNKVGLLLSLKKFDIIPETLSLIRNIPIKYNLVDKEKISVRLNLRTYNVELEMYRDIKDFEKAEQLIVTIEDFLHKNQKSIIDSYRVLFYYQFAYIYFMLRNYNKSLHWTNELLQNDFAKVRDDVYTYSRFLNLMIHFELGNNIVLKYAVDATRKHFKKRRNLFHFEKVLLNFFSKISMARQEKHKTLFKKLKENLFIKTEEKKKLTVLDYIDFEEWINNKLTKS